MKPIGTSILNLGRLVALPVLSLTLATPSFAQGEDSSFLEEITVVAQKRAQNIMDVPVAITAVTGAQIEASGIKDMIDLQQSVPGLIVGGSQTATTTNFSIRGIGSTSNNFGVESSVGLYVDGVYRSRQSSLINELVDVQAVEVLRGPQGTLFGKNTASGAINVRTVAPNTDGHDAFIEFTAGDYDLARISAATNIVLSDKLAFRGTLFSSQRDGYVTDDNFNRQVSNRDGPVEDLYNDRDRLGLRMQLAYDNLDDFNLRVIADYAEIDEVCCIGTTRVDSLFSRGGLAAGQVINGPDAILMQMGGTVYTDQNYPFPLPPNVVQADWEDYRTSLNFAPISQNEDRGISVEMNKTLGGGSTFTSVSAYRQFDTFDSIDADFTDTSIAERTNEASQKSFSQEFRLAGEFGEDSNWVAGAYYFAQDIKSNTRTIGGTQLQTYSDIGLLAQGSPFSMTDITNAVTAISQGLGAAGIPFPTGAQGFPAGAFANDNVLQEHDGYAVFGQVDWALTDSFEVSLGARYTDESKDIDAVYTQTNPGTLVPDLTAIGTSIVLFQQWAGGGMVGAPPDLTPLLAVAQPNDGWAAWTLAPFSPRPDVRESLSDDQITGTLKGTWFVSDNKMAYVSYSTGFKSGGTNTDRIWSYLPQLFAAEESKSIEVGFKGDLGERLRVSVALYQTDFDDFQANSFTGTGFNLQNAGDLEVKGVELEWLWQPLDNTAVSGYYAHNEGEFNSFELGTCWSSGPFHGFPDPGLDPATMTCSRSGEAIPYNPEDRFNLGVTQTFPMGNNEMFLRAEYAWASEQLTDGDNDPLTKMDDFGILNVRLGYDIESWNSTITLWGRNVTDERYYGGSYDPPLLDTGRTNSYPSEPATYGITFRKNWD